MGQSDKQVWGELSLKEEQARVCPTWCTSGGGTISGTGSTDCARLEQFTRDVGDHVARSAVLDSELASKATDLAHELLQDKLLAGISRLGDKSGPNPPLLLLNSMSGELSSIAWEALRWGSDPEYAAYHGDFSIARLAGSASSSSPDPEVVCGTVRVLFIAPVADEKLIEEYKARIRLHAKRINVEFLTPIWGTGARKRNLKRSVDHVCRNEGPPHIVHFLGHGRVVGNKPPELLLWKQGAEDEEEEWADAAVLKDALEAHAAQTNLVVFESCESALREDDTFASAAELMARSISASAIGFRWTVNIEKSRAFFEAFYGALTSDENAAGDVARSVVLARRTAFGRGAMGFSPVVFLRTRRSVLFRPASVGGVVAATAPTAVPNPVAIQKVEAVPAVEARPPDPAKSHGDARATPDEARQARQAMFALVGTGVGGTVVYGKVKGIGWFTGLTFATKFLVGAFIVSTAIGGLVLYKYLNAADTASKGLEAKGLEASASTATNALANGAGNEPRSATKTPAPSADTPTPPPTTPRVPPPVIPVPSVYPTGCSGNGCSSSPPSPMPSANAPAQPSATTAPEAPSAAPAPSVAPPTAATSSWNPGPGGPGNFIPDE